MEQTKKDKGKIAKINSKEEWSFVSETKKIQIENNGLKKTLKKYKEEIVKIRKISNRLGRIFLLCAIMSSMFSCKDSDPYSEGMHWDYSITCEGGFVYKSLNHHRGTILILNSDETPLRCGKKRY